jgi:hypothetical protein
MWVSGFDPGLHNSPFSACVYLSMGWLLGQLAK